MPHASWKTNQPLQDKAQKRLAGFIKNLCDDGADIRYVLDALDILQWEAIDIIRETYATRKTVPGRVALNTPVLKSIVFS